MLQKESFTVNTLIKKMPYKEPKVLQVIRFMMDNEKIAENEQMKLHLVNKD